MEEDDCNELFITQTAKEISDNDVNCDDEDEFDSILGGHGFSVTCIINCN